MSTIITMAYLLVLGIVDWKKKAIQLWMLIAMGIIAIVSRIAEYILIGRGISIYEIVAGIGIAAVLIIIGLRGHMLGVADSIVVGIIIYHIFKIVDSKYPHTRRIPIIGFAICLVFSYVAEAYFGIADITGAYVAGII